MNKNDKKTLLIFTAHPDDHLMCAGTAMYLKDLGFEISEVVFTGGEKSVFLTNKKTGLINKEELKKVRKEEFAKASKIIGTNRAQFLGLPNNNIVRTPKLIDQIVKIVRQEKPTIIMSESPFDYHIDHREIGKIITEAIDRAGWGVSKELGEPHKTPIGLYMGCTLLENQRIDMLVDVSMYWSKKLKILEVYGSQMSSFGFQLSEALDKYCGYKMRTEYGEGYQLINNYPIKLNVLFEIFDYEKKQIKE